MADESAGDASPNPLDDLRVQLPGRLITLEVLVTLLIAEKATAGRILRDADQTLALYESEIVGKRTGDDVTYAMKMFEASRAALDMIGRNARRARKA